jgi:hypothetical protein
VRIDDGEVDLPAVRWICKARHGQAPAERDDDVWETDLCDGAGRRGLCGGTKRRCDGSVQRREGRTAPTVE